MMEEDDKLKKLDDIILRAAEKLMSLLDVSRANDRIIKEYSDLIFLDTLYTQYESYKDQMNVDIDVLLRARYALVVGAIDDYLHQVRIEQMVKMFSLEKEPTDEFKNFQIPMSVFLNIQEEKSIEKRKELFAEYVYEKYKSKSYLSVKVVNEVTRTIGIDDIWKLVRKKLEQFYEFNISEDDVKRLISEAFHRRNQIVHESDYCKSGIKNKITKAEVDGVVNLAMFLRSCIEEHIANSDKQN